MEHGTRVSKWKSIIRPRWLISSTEFAEHCDIAINITHKRSTIGLLARSKPRSTHSATMLPCTHPLPRIDSIDGSWDLARGQHRRPTTVIQQNTSLQCARFDTVEDGMMPAGYRWTLEECRDDLLAFRCNTAAFNCHSFWKSISLTWKRLAEPACLHNTHLCKLLAGGVQSE